MKEDQGDQVAEQQKLLAGKVSTAGIDLSTLKRLAVLLNKFAFRWNWRSRGSCD